MARVGDTLIDGSLKRRFALLRTQIASGGNHRVVKTMASLLTFSDCPVRPAQRNSSLTNRAKARTFRRCLETDQPSPPAAAAKYTARQRYITPRQSLDIRSNSWLSRTKLRESYVIV